MWTVPGLNDPDAVNLDVATSVLGGLASSRLDNELVKKEQLAVAVSAGLQAFEKVGLVEVYADVKPGVDPDVAGRSQDRKGVVWGKSVSVRVDSGGCRSM